MNCYWVSFNPTNPVHLRWDERLPADIIDQNPKCVGDHLDVTHIDDTRTFMADCRGGAVSEMIVVYPAGGCSWKHAGQLAAELDRPHIDHVILFVVSDEASTFPIHIMRPLGDKIDLWVMTPQPEINYDGFRSVTFIGDGDAWAATLVTPGSVDKDLDVVFLGQDNHTRRAEAIEAAGDCTGNNMIEPTDGFTKGRERSDYMRHMARAKVVPCPSGLVSQDSFRAYEALTMGAVPVLDDLRRDGGGSGYWEMIDPTIGDHMPLITDWRNLPAISATIIDNWPLTPVLSHGWWHRHRRDLAHRFATQAKSTGGELTVIVVTSVIPDHPDTSMLEVTLASIRERTDAEILILCDGVRSEQSEEGQRYLEYVRRVMLLAESWVDVTPVFFEEFSHQSGMMRRALDEFITSEYVMFIEHDTPLVGEIPIDRILTDMNTGVMNLVRFYHEAAVHEEHAAMFLEATPKEGWPYVRTVQWSQRPHIARCSFYADLMSRFFSSDARTMLEDVLYPAEEFAWRKHGMESAWREWKTVLYAPEGGYVRSGHLDGRADDPKYPMLFDYPPETDQSGLPAPGYR